MKGKLSHKQNSWYIRAVGQGRELDEIKFEYYPIAFSESCEIELKEGIEVEFEIREVNYTDLDGLGQELIRFAIIL